MAMVTLFPHTRSGPASGQLPTTQHAFDDPSLHDNDWLTWCHTEFIAFPILVLQLVPGSVRAAFSLAGNMNPTRTVGKVTDPLAMNGLSSRPLP